MDWREIYARRLCTPEQAAALIAPGDRIFAGGAGSFPAVLIDAVSDRAELRGIPVVTVVNGTESRALSDPVCFARTPYHSLFLGRADRKFQQRGGLHIAGKLSGIDPDCFHETSLGAASGCRASPRNRR